MAKPNHAKRSRPRPPVARRRKLRRATSDERRTRRELERWQRG